MVREEKSPNVNRDTQSRSNKREKSQKSNENSKKDNYMNKFKFRDDEVEYRKQLERVMQDDDFMVQGPMITEEEETEIKNIASDINERAFYGKLLKTK
jgi:hypothetical protein